MCAPQCVQGSVGTLFGRLDYHSNRVCEKKRAKWLPPGFCTVAELVGAFQPPYPNRSHYVFWLGTALTMAETVFSGMFGQRTVVFEDGSTPIFRKDDDYAYGYYGASLDWGYLS